MNRKVNNNQSVIIIKEKVCVVSNVDNSLVVLGHEDMLRGICIRYCLLAIGLDTKPLAAKE